MPADPGRFQTQLSLLRSESSEERVDAAELLAGWWQHLDQEQSRAAARGLAEAASVEGDDVAREVELHALVELHNASLFSRDDLAALRARPRSTLNEDDLEYAEVLEDAFGPLFAE